jgi:hypothetical protein
VERCGALLCVLYHAISVWIPGLGGLIAWLPGRARPLADAAAGLPAAQPDAALAVSN